MWRNVNLAALAVSLLLSRNLPAQTLPVFDFSNTAVAKEWAAPHDISGLRATDEGLEITIGGNDPYFFGPKRDFPVDTPLWLIVRLWAEESGPAEVFYFRDHPRAGNSVQFYVAGGRWAEHRVAFPSLGPGFQLRIDPPGTKGKAVLATIRFEKRVLLPEPVWPTWEPPSGPMEVVLRKGELELLHSRTAPLLVQLRFGDQLLGGTHAKPRFAYMRNDAIRWVEFGAADSTRVEIANGIVNIRSLAKDIDGGEWTLEDSYRVAGQGTIEANVSLTINKERQIVFAPLHLLFAGDGSFGRDKNQALFAGLEYLENEPSSSEADIIGSESNRRVPVSHKITFPLMAVQANDRYAGLIWEDTRRMSALFDTPDRTFGSGGHVMGVLFPGDELVQREEGNLLPYSAAMTKVNTPIVSRAWLIAGRGRDVTPAVEHYVRLRGWPELPRLQMAFGEYVNLAALGWSASKIREGQRYRHAFWPGFNPQPAADAALFETWLSGHTPDSQSRSKLRALAAAALEAVPVRNYYHSAVSHVRPPAVPLVFGGVPEAVKAAKATAQAQLSRFDAKGAILYKPSATGPDYGKTHFAPDANGLTAQVLATALDAAAFCGDRTLIEQAIRRLEQLGKFAGTVPRGAQTWEVPLHTPDILASASMVRAYATGYELTGRAEFLEEATYWAWTGVPFVYLVNPTSGEVGSYSTIAVLGATNWKAPVWFGRPVQWCGLVYADALYRLAKLQPDAPWKNLADGITAAGIQHTWPADDSERVGLLPDFFELREQLRAGPAINPGTVGALAVRYFEKGELYDFRASREQDFFIHAPGEINVLSDTASNTAFTVQGWPSESYYVLLSGFTEKPRIKLGESMGEPEFDPEAGTLILRAKGHARIEVAR